MRDAWPHQKVIVCAASFLYKQLCLTFRYFKRWTGSCYFYRPWSLLSFILQLSSSWCTAAPFSSTFIVTGDAKSTMRTSEIFGTARNKWSQHFSMPMEHFGMVSRFAGQYLVIYKRNPTMNSFSRSARFVHAIFAGLVFVFTIGGFLYDFSLWVGFLRFFFNFHSGTIAVTLPSRINHS